MTAHLHLVSAALDPTRFRAALLERRLDQLWLQRADLTIGQLGLTRYSIYDARDGVAVPAESLGPSLSADGLMALRLAVDDATIGYQFFRDGQQVASDQGHPEDASFARAFAQRIDVELDALLPAALPPDDDGSLASEQTELLVRGRFLSVPAGTPRCPHLMHFHTRVLIEGRADRDDLDDLDAEAPGPKPDEDEGHAWEPSSAGEAEHMALVLLDPTRAEQLYGAPASELARFIEAIAPFGPAVMGPLAEGFGELVAAVGSLSADDTLADDTTRDPLCYEVLAMSSAVGYLVGDSVAYFDQVFFPLLSLADTEPTAELVGDSLDDIAGVDLLTAMTEVLPYRVPEGELLESFADDEIRPLVEWGVVDGAYEGSLFLVETTRLRQLVESFDAERFDRTVERFLRTWHAASDDERPFDAWRAQRAERDELELGRFIETLTELNALLALGRCSALSVGLLFFST